MTKYLILHVRVKNISEEQVKVTSQIIFDKLTGNLRERKQNHNRITAIEGNKCSYQDNSLGNIN